MTPPRPYQFRQRKEGLMLIGLAVAMGMGGELHLPVPGLGYVAMFDFVAYILAIPLLCTQWSRMGKAMRRSLVWALVWTAAAMLANLVNFGNLRYWAKCVAVVSSSWAIMVVAYQMLKNHPRLYLWYLMGVGIGGWIALYHFRNGAIEYFATKGNYGGVGYGVDLLQDKQVYPSIVKGVFFGCVLPVFLVCKRFPVFGVIVATFVAGFMLLIHGGSRSNFGMFCAAALVGFVVAYGKSFYRRLAKSRFVMAMVGCFALMVIFGAYKIMATTGSLGEGEQRKYEKEFGREESSGVSGRMGLDHALSCLKQSAGIGLGGMLRCHSVMMNSLACEGVVGFLFWVYFYLQVFWWMCRRMPYSGKHASFICLMLMDACWDVFGSPFGTRHKFFVFMAFAALCQDSKFYGVATLFDEKLLQTRER